MPGGRNVLMFVPESEQTGLFALFNEDTGRTAQAEDPIDFFLPPPDVPTDFETIYNEVDDFSDFDTIDDADIATVEDALSRILKRPKDVLVGVDVSHTTMCCANFIRLLIQTWKQLCKQEGRRLGLIGVSPDIHEVLEAAQLLRIFELFESRDELLSDYRE